MSAIEIKGLEVQACHGVLDSEKRNAQPFLFDIYLDFDNFAACTGDRLEDTVNYSAVCRLVYNFCKYNCFSLIERLAYGAAVEVLKNFSVLKRVRVTVHKPHAPVNLPFEDIAVNAVAERCKAVLSLGASEGDRKAALDGAIKRLGETDGVKVLKVSRYIETKPYGGAAHNNFLNCALLCECILPPRALLDVLHGIEAEFGRVRSVRWGDRTLDMDIIFFGDKIICEDGLCVPHPDYFNRDFVLIPIKEIVPDFVCPLRHKRVSDM